MDKLRGARYFTKLDIQWGYNNIMIKDGDQWKGAFKTKLGLFKPTVMFFRICNSPATFQKMMDKIFKDEIHEAWVIIYMDDVLVFTKDQYFTVPHIVHRTPVDSGKHSVDSGKRLVDVWWTMTGLQQTPANIRWTFGGQ